MEKITNDEFYKVVFRGVSRGTVQGLLSADSCPV